MSEMVKISDTEWVKTSGNVDYSEINEIKDSLNNNTIITSGLTYSNCTYENGGYTKVGKIVIVNIRITTGTTSRLTISGFPKPKLSGDSYVTIYSNSTSGVGAITSSGVLTHDGHSANGVGIIGAMYICE